MATVIRIKRRFDEEPAESIVIASKRARSDVASILGSVVSDTIDELNQILLERVATVSNEDELLEPHLKKLMHEYRNKLELIKYYKKPNLKTLNKEEIRKENRKRVETSRFKIISARREEASSGESLGSEGQLEASGENGSHISKSIKIYDAVEQDCPLASLLKDDVITCNGKPMETEKFEYVWDVFYTSAPLEDKHWVENICEIQQYKSDLVIGASDSDDTEDDDDSNDENNWRNDYPEESEKDSLEEEEDFLTKQLHKAKIVCSDESYDADDYEGDFDEEGKIIPANELTVQHKFKSGVSDDSASSSDDD